MQQGDYQATENRPKDLGEDAWSDVLRAMDQSYAELVNYQERLEAQNDELQALRAFLDSVMVSITDYLIVIGRDGVILDASRSFCDMVGLDKAALTGRHIGEFFSPGESERVVNAIGHVLRMKQEMSTEAQLATGAGSEDPVEFRIAPRLDRRRRVSGAVLTGRPLGELRRAYSELEQSHDALKDAQTQLVRNEKLASLGRLLAGVAHELNNPISFVYANAHALEKYAARFEEYFDRVQAGAERDELVRLRAELKLDRELVNMRSAIVGARDGAERVRDIVEDLRRLSAEGTGEMAQFDLAATAQLAANWIERGTKKDIEFVFEGDAPCFAMGRHGHIQQVLLNLVQNAVDAMSEVEAPRVVISTAYEGETAVATVCDNGPGVPETIAQAVFDPFFTTKEVGKGTGLGLSISHKIAEEHGGALAILPGDGQGACFKLSLPKGRAE